MGALGSEKNIAGTVMINGRKVAGWTKGEAPSKTLWLHHGEGGAH